MNEPNKNVSAYYKVPFREVYCVTRWYWLKAVIRCHLLHRLGL